MIRRTKENEASNPNCADDPSLPARVTTDITASAIPAATHSAQQEFSATQKISPITIFAIPKPFTGSTAQIQRNAVNSWSRLPGVEVLLIGDESGIESTAQELGVRHAGGIAFNEQGTPLISSAFEIAHQHSNSPLLVYCNCDVILLEDFAISLRRIELDEWDHFVAFGRRTDLEIDGEIDFDDRDQIQLLQQRIISNGEKCSIVCKEFFAYPRSLYASVPDFAVGRGNWDNWMIHHAKKNRIAVIDISKTANVIHQTHDYSHTGKPRWSCYVSGVEAKLNQRLAGGRHVISGSTPTHYLGDQGVTRNRLSGLNLAFWADIPRFLRLMTNLMFSR